MRILVTGTPGNNTSTLIESSIDILINAEEIDENFPYCHIGRRIFELATSEGIPIKAPELVLSHDTTRLESLRKRAFEDALRQLESAKGGIISSPSIFYSPSSYIFALPENLFGVTNEPFLDVIVSVIDNPHTTLSKLNESQQWGPLEIDMNRLLEWCGLDIGLARLLANSQGIPHYVLPAKSLPLNLAKLVLGHEAKVVYVAYGMTGRENDEGYHNAINNFVSKLSRRYVIISPNQFENPNTSPSIPEKRIIAKRDLDWVIRSVDFLIAYAPDGRVSLGTSHEMRVAMELSMPVYLLSNSSEHYDHHPFVADTIPPGCCFSKEEELFNYLDNKYGEPSYDNLINQTTSD